MENHKIGELRYKNYLSRYQATVKMVLDERKSLLLKANGSYMSKNALNFSLPMLGGSLRTGPDYHSVITSSNTNHRVHLMP